MKSIYIFLFFTVAVYAVCDTDLIYNKVLEIYRDLGFSIDAPKPGIVYCSYEELNSCMDIKRVAYYNSSKCTIYISTFETYEKDIARCCREIYESIIFHEFTHYLNNIINPEIIPTHDEVIACGLQLLTLNSKTLKSYFDKPYKRFSNIHSARLLYYLNEPDGFKIASYIFCRDNFNSLKYIILNSHKICRDPFFFDFK